MVISTNVSIITLNINGQNSPIKRHRVAEWIKQKTNKQTKPDPSKCCLQETHFRYKDTQRLKVKEWKKEFHTKGNQNKAGVAILILYKIDFKTKTVIKDKDGNYLVIKESI